MKTMDKTDAYPVSSLLGAIPAVLALGLLAAVGLAHFLVFHVVIELFTVSVSFAAFLIAWNMRKRLDSGFFLLIAISYAALSLLDLAHLLTYRGMGLFPELSINIPMQFWVAARYVQAFSLLVAPLFVHQMLPARPAFTFYAILVVVLTLAIVRPWPFLPAFPDCYVEGAIPPLTRFKVASEYIVCGILAAALVLFVLVRRSLDRGVVVFMTGSLAATIVSELLFARFVDLFGGLNLAGHLLKGLAFYLAYKALVEAELIRPFEVLFRSATQSRQQVLESEERFRTLSAATFEGIAITENGRIVDVNEQLLVMLGCRREDLIGEPITAFLVPDDRERVLQSIREGEGQVDYRMIRKDGAFIQAETHGKMVHFKNRTVRVTAIRDITERKRAEQALLEARNAALRSARELARSNADLEQFARVTSHDLKEPLRMVTGFLGLLRDQYDARLDDRGREYVGFAVDASRAMQRLIDDLLEYSRIGSDKRLEPVRLEEAVRAAMANLHIATRSADVAIRWDPLPPVYANRPEMVLLYQNLLSNAVKFRPPGRAADIRIGVRTKDVEPEFFVRDNGIGIDPAYHDRLFQIFQRLHPPEDYPGSGLGLAICKKIVERYGGAIRIESAPGQGTAVLFTLPDARRAEQLLGLPPGGSGAKLPDEPLVAREGDR